MFISKIEIENYRNIEKAIIEPARGTTVIYGRNGQGKTNALEAVNFFAQGRSFRTRREKELIRGFPGIDGLKPDFPETPPDFARIAVCYTSDGRQNVSEVVISRDGQKKMSRNGVVITRMAEFIGSLRAVLFAPEHMTLVKGGPSERRTFVDLAVSQFNPVYLASLQRYNRLLEQRNALLRDWKTLSQASKDSLSTYSPRMAKEAAYITSQRASYLEKLDVRVRELVSEMTMGREKICIVYGGCHTEAEFSRAFDDFMNRDIEAGITTGGPHREDFEILMNGASARQLASQGQQRTIVLAVKIGESRIARDVSGEYPVCLFDDVMSEIDGGRRAFILQSFPERQVIVTCCDDNLPAGNDESTKYYRVERGRFELQSREGTG